MISLHQPRHIAAGDYYQISRLAFNDANVHRHLDWRSPLEWIGSPNYWALEEYGKLTAILACPEDPPQVAWIRIFAHQPHLSAREAWTAVWETAHREIAPHTTVAAIATRQWFQNLLLASRFEAEQNIVMLELLLDYPRSFSAPRDFHIRPMRVEDIPAIAGMDLESFGAFWHNTADTLQRARAAAMYATVAEDASGLLGYQISTGGASNVHLARLAVKPQAQGMGIGGALVNDLIARTGVSRYSVNTQQNNTASLALYKKAGFIRTGESFPVLTYPIS